VLTGAIRNQIDQVWNAFWAGGIANPLEVIEQITYLLFLRRLDDYFGSRRVRGDCRLGRRGHLPVTTKAEKLTPCL
jgi:type I restriction enzyme M protein